MKYFVSQEWNNTKGNHAGMSHLCDLIKKSHPNEVRHYKVPCFNFKFSRPIYHLWYIILGIVLMFKVNKGDTVFLMEYLFPTRRQDFVAWLLNTFTQTRVEALAHLVPKELDKLFPTDKKLNQWCNKVDRLMTLGTSLTNYLKSREVQTELLTMFHYVDLGYYKMKKRVSNERPKVLFMGTMQRNFDTLEYIVSNCPLMDFYFLKGKSKRDTTNIERFKNIIICDFLAEDELKQLMNECDISLNLMYDTVGSNVITTSLAMGMVMIVSDVGSIHDYCDKSNAFFCKDANDFVIQLNRLCAKKDDFTVMSSASLSKAQSLSSENFYQSIIKHG